jgi:hypothetical protein
MQHNLYGHQFQPKWRNSRKVWQTKRKLWQNA